jgi:hypothetical protein
MTTPRRRTPGRGVPVGPGAYGASGGPGTPHPERYPVTPKQRKKWPYALLAIAAVAGASAALFGEFDDERSKDGPVFVAPETSLAPVPSGAGNADPKLDRFASCRLVTATKVGELLRLTPDDTSQVNGKGERLIPGKSDQCTYALTRNGKALGEMTVLVTCVQPDAADHWKKWYVDGPGQDMGSPSGAMVRPIEEGGRARRAGFYDDGCLAEVTVPEDITDRLSGMMNIVIYDARYNPAWQPAA